MAKDGVHGVHRSYKQWAELARNVQEVLALDRARISHIRCQWGRELSKAQWSVLFISILVGFTQLCFGIYRLIL